MKKTDQPTPLLQNDKRTKPGSQLIRPSCPVAAALDLPLPYFNTTDTSRTKVSSSIHAYFLTWRKFQTIFLEVNFNSR
jgi:hypothetical protein